MTDKTKTTKSTLKLERGEYGYDKGTYSGTRISKGVGRDPTYEGASAHFHVRIRRIHTYPVWNVDIFRGASVSSNVVSHEQFIGTKDGVTCFARAKAWAIAELERLEAARVA